MFAVTGIVPATTDPSLTSLAPLPPPLPPLIIPNELAIPFPSSSSAGQQAQPVQQQTVGALPAQQSASSVVADISSRLTDMQEELQQLRTHKEWADSRIKDLLRKVCDREKPLAEENKVCYCCKGCIVRAELHFLICFQVHVRLCIPYCICAPALQQAVAQQGMSGAAVTVLESQCCWHPCSKVSQRAATTACNQQRVCTPRAPCCEYMTPCVLLQVLREEVGRLRQDKKGLESRNKELQDAVAKFKDANYRETAAKRQLETDLKAVKAELEAAQLREAEMASQLAESQVSKCNLQQYFCASWS